MAVAREERGMRRILRIGLDGVILTMTVAALFFGYQWWSRGRELLLLDRPRQGNREPDLVARYLKSTGMPFEYREGFVAIAIEPETTNHLLRLLAQLARAIDAEEFNRDSLREDPAAPLVAWSLNSSGVLELVPGSPSYGAPSQHSSRRLENERALRALVSQYQAVREGVERLRLVAGSVPVNPPVAALCPHDDQAAPLSTPLGPRQASHAEPVEVLDASPQ